MSQKLLEKLERYEQDDPEYCSGYEPSENAGGGKGEKLF